MLFVAIRASSADFVRVPESCVRPDESVLPVQCFLFPRDAVEQFAAAAASAASSATCTEATTAGPPPAQRARHHEDGNESCVGAGTEAAAAREDERDADASQSESDACVVVKAAGVGDGDSSAGSRLRALWASMVPCVAVLEVAAVALDDARSAGPAAGRAEHLHLVFVTPLDADLKRVGTRGSRPAGMECIDCVGLVSMLWAQQLVAPGVGACGVTQGCQIRYGPTPTQAL
jgi:hypothetical protein